MNKFSLEQRSNDNAEIIYLNGFLDAHTAPQLESAISSIIAGGKHKIVVNFRSLEYISSAGLGVFMSLLRKSVQAMATSNLLQCSQRFLRCSTCWVFLCCLILSKPKKKPLRNSHSCAYSWA
jgi:anti-sigma B factor antagonist